MVVKNVEKYRFGHSMINSMFMLVSQRKPRNQVTINNGTFVKRIVVIRLNHEC